MHARRCGRIRAVQWLAKSQRAKGNHAIESQIGYKSSCRNLHTNKSGHRQPLSVTDTLAETNLRVLTRIMLMADATIRRGSYVCGTYVDLYVCGPPGQFDTLTCNLLIFIFSDDFISHLKHPSQCIRWYQGVSRFDWTCGSRFVWKAFIWFQSCLFYSGYFLFFCKCSE